MGKGKGNVQWEEHSELLQYLLYIFNTVFFCVGAMVFAVAMWIRFDKDLSDYVDGLGMNHYYTGDIVVMVGAVLVMLNCFIACCGVYFDSKALIIVYIVMTFITFILLMVGSVYTIVNGLESTNIYPWIQTRMSELINQYQWDVAARRGVDIVQEYVGCCGGYSSQDYTNIHMPVPNTCRDQVTGNQYKHSCAEVFSQYLEIRTGWLAGLSLTLCFFQCFAVMISTCMYMAIKERKAMKRDRI